MTSAKHSRERAPAVVILDREECLRLLAGVPAARLVFTEHALPAVRLVNFVVHYGAVVVGGEGGKLTAATDGAVVALEAVDAVAGPDRASPSSAGRKAVTDAEGVAELSALPLVPCAPGNRGRFIRLHVTHVTGRASTPLPASRYGRFGRSGRDHRL